MSGLFLDTVRPYRSSDSGAVLPPLSLPQVCSAKEGTSLSKEDKIYLELFVVLQSFLEYVKETKDNVKGFNQTEVYNRHLGKITDPDQKGADKAKAYIVKIEFDADYNMTGLDSPIGVTEDTRNKIAGLMRDSSGNYDTAKLGEAVSSVFSSLDSSHPDKKLLELFVVLQSFLGYVKETKDNVKGFNQTEVYNRHLGKITDPDLKGADKAKAYIVKIEFDADYNMTGLGSPIGVTEDTRNKIAGLMKDSAGNYDTAKLGEAVRKVLRGSGSIACLVPYLNDPVLQLSLSMGPSGKGKFENLEPKGDSEKSWFNYGIKGGHTIDLGNFKLRVMGYTTGEVYKEKGGETPNTWALGLGLKAFYGNESIAGELYGYWDSIHNKHQNFGNFSRLNARNDILTGGGALITDFGSSGFITLRGFAEYSRNFFTNYRENYLKDYEINGFDQTGRFGGSLKLYLSSLAGLTFEAGGDRSIGNHETASFDGTPPNYIYDTKGWSLQFSLGMPNLSLPWKIFHTYREQGLEAHEKTFQRIGGVGLYFNKLSEYVPDIEVIFGSYNTNPYYPTTTDPFVTTKLSLRVYDGDGAWLPNIDVSISAGADKQIDRAAGIGRNTWYGYGFGGVSFTWDAAPKKKD